MYQDTNKPIILTMLISKNKPNLNLINPNSTQLFSVAPNPIDLDNKKKFLTTPSGKKKDITKLIIVPTNTPISKTKNINWKFFFITSNYLTLIQK